MKMVQINVKGPVVNDSDKFIYDYYHMPAVAPKDINDALPDDGSDVDVVINSGGGLIDAGSEIYTALKNYSGKVNVNIVGMAASAASFIAMAGDHIAMSPTAQMMIHNVQSGLQGDSAAHAHEAQVLDSFNQSIAAPYVDKTGMSQEEVLAIMDKTTFLNAEQAKEKGLIDEIMFDNDKEDDLQLAASYNAGLLSPDAIAEARKNMDNETPAEPTETLTKEDVLNMINEATKDIKNEATNTIEQNEPNEQPKTNRMFVF